MFTSWLCREATEIIDHGRAAHARAGMARFPLAPLHQSGPHHRASGGDLQFRAAKCFLQHVEAVVGVSTSLARASTTRSESETETAIAGACRVVHSSSLLGVDDNLPIRNISSYRHNVYANN
ncbi:hypothetical protein KM043_015484 [Ampulex compressa]|nr:hypothetical protein KM043_015484 [Ampulex compressa]